ncbi:MAG: radical SAM family heme chaperone HemW [Pseudomonadota bacterium]
MKQDRTSRAAEAFGVYVHWPFCAAKCPYCDFNSHVARSQDEDRWRQAFVRAIARAGADLPDGRVESIFFGGGTPSLMPAETVAAILDAIAAEWAVAADVEVTLEANPTSVEAERFAGFRAAGVNRLSLGVQALDDRALHRLGRLHDAAEARRALEIAKAHFERVSFDLIYARQDQNVADWRAELAEALALADGHLSLYQLTIEPGTAFGMRHAAGRLSGLPCDDLGADLFALTQEMCAAAGLPAYEISNHARPGMESRHNLNYWRGGGYLGIGPGAHGRVPDGPGGRLATSEIAAPDGWLVAVEACGTGRKAAIALTPGERAEEYAMMALRTVEGMNLERHCSFAGRPLPGERMTALIEAGLLRQTEGRVSLTAAGQPLLNAVLRELLV